MARCDIYVRNRRGCGDHHFSKLASSLEQSVLQSFETFLEWFFLPIAYIDTPFAGAAQRLQSLNCHRNCRRNIKDDLFNIAACCFVGGLYKVMHKIYEMLFWTTWMYKIVYFTPNKELRSLIPATLGDHSSKSRWNIGLTKSPGIEVET